MTSSRPARPSTWLVRCDVLPVGEEPHEVGDARPARPAPAATPAGGVQAHQQVAGAPATVGQLDGRARRLEAGQRRARPGRASAVHRGRRPAGSGRRPPAPRRSPGPASSRWPLTQAAAASSSAADGAVPPRRPLGGHPAARRPRRPGRRPPARRTKGCHSRYRTADDQRQQEIVQLVGVARARARPGRAPRPRPRGRAGRARPPATGQPVGAELARVPAAPTPRGSAAPRAARRRGTCRAARSGSRGPGARARPTRRSGPRPRPTRCRAQGSTRPSTSRGLAQAVVDGLARQHVVGHGTGPGAAFSWQAASAGQVAASRSSASMRWRWMGRRWPPRDPRHDEGAG